MCAWFPIHQIRTRNTRADRQTRTDTFRNANNVGLNIVMLAREHLARATHSRLHLVDD
jgi:hypothetical protein